MKILIFILFLTFTSYSQVTTKIYPYDGDTYFRFGYKLSIDSNFFAISSYNGSLGAGAVYIYKTGSSKVNFVQKILPDTSYFGYRFGSPVLLADSLLFIGATKKVHIYQCYNDSIFQKIDVLIPFDPVQTEQFGRAISEYNKNLFIGAYLDGPLDKGAAYFYEYADTGWVFKQKIYPSVAERHAQFGSRLVHSNQFAVISAPGDGFESGSFRGSVFLCSKTDSGWVEKQKILPTDSTYNQLFGIDLALDNRRIAIGAVGNSLNQSFNGRIYIYEINDNGIAELQDSIFASDNFPGNNFGWSFRLRGDSLFVGASGNEYMAAYSKIGQQRTWAYLFVKTKNGWEEELIFEPSDPHPQNVFGYAVDFLNGNFLVGSPGDPTNGFQSGAVYLFQPNITSVSEEIYFINQYTLFQNYPNPFNPKTKIKYFIPSSEIVQVKVYNILGKEIKTLLNEYKQSGIYEIEFDANNLPSGIYFYRIISGGYVETKKMILLK